MGAIGKGRLEYVDVAKGLAIIGVYFGHHAVLPDSMTNWFWAFHMPLFFIITGMYSHRLTEQNIRKVFNVGFRNLVVPYFLTEFGTTCKNVWIQDAIKTQDFTLFQPKGA